MNYLKQMKGYHSRRIIEPLNSNAQALYTNLIELFNSSMWREVISPSVLQLRGLSDLSEGAFERARADLVDGGYITYFTASGRANGLYKLIQLYTEPELSVTQTIEYTPGAAAASPDPASPPANPGIQPVKVKEGQIGGQSEGQSEGQTEGQSEGQSEAQTAAAAAANKIYIYNPSKTREEKDKTAAPPGHRYNQAAFERFCAEFPDKLPKTRRISIPTDLDFDLLLKKVRESAFLTDIFDLPRLIKHREKVFADFYRSYNSAGAAGARSPGPGFMQREYTAADFDSTIDDWVYEKKEPAAGEPPALSPSAAEFAIKEEEKAGGT